jgi:hypothetical protein
MKRFLIAFILALLVKVSFAASLPQHPNSIKPLFSGEDAICTTFSINSVKGLWVTAGHCVGEVTLNYDTQEQVAFVWETKIDGKPTTLVKADFKADLALLHVDVHEKGIKLGKYPNVGDEVLVYGYPGGWRTPILTWLRVSNTFHQWQPDDSYWPSSMIFDGSVFPGHSGAPILDKKHNVISVAQGGGSGAFIGLQLGAPWSVLKAFVEDRWEK